MRIFLSERQGARKKLLTVALILSTIVIGGCQKTANDEVKPAESSNSTTQKSQQKQNFVGSIKEKTSSTSQSTSESSAEQTSTQVSSEKQVEKQAEELQRNNEQENAELANLEFSGTQTIDVNNGDPGFAPADLTTENGAWEKYGDLDSLNRATSAEALLNQSLMPTEKRGDISSVKPTGWHSKKINGGYLYNRSHLIGFALAGENANWKNLITGTRQLNSPEMLRHEMDIKYYLEQSPDHYVRYSVIPIFRGDELLARGVHLRAQAVNSDAIKFNVYIFNVQEGVTLNYADGTSQIDAEVEAAQQAQEQQEQAAAQAQTATEQEQARQAQAQQAEADQPAQGQQAAPATGQVYVTPTGARYHSHPHGNGNFTPATLEEAQNRGLTPCQVCQ